MDPWRSEETSIYHIFVTDLLLWSHFLCITRIMANSGYIYNVVKQSIFAQLWESVNIWRKFRQNELSCFGSKMNVYPLINTTVFKAPPRMQQRPFSRENFKDINFYIRIQQLGSKFSKSSFTPFSVPFHTLWPLVFYTQNTAYCRRS